MGTSRIDLMADLQCTWWPDNWFGLNITDCCKQHDLGASDWELFLCVGEQDPRLWPVAFAMLIGLSTFGVIYRKLQRK